MAKRVALVSGVMLLVVALIALYVALYLTNVPGSYAASQTPAGASIYLASVPAAEASDPHNTWVSFYAVSANGTNWRHDTTYVLPANSLVHMTIYQFDTPTGLRNPFFGQVRGTTGGTFLLNGKPTQVISPDLASHVFAIPELHVSVPLEGVPTSAKNPCSQAPCSLSNDHETISFTFKTGARGLYRWQCFVPCGAGFIQGFGGPMQTVGYMDGYIKVV